MGREFLLVAIGAGERVLATEILYVAEPVAHDALRQPAPEMRPDPPEDHPDLIVGVILDRQATYHDKPASVLDLMVDLGD